MICDTNVAGPIPNCVFISHFARSLVIYTKISMGNMSRTSFQAKILSSQTHASAAATGAMNSATTDNVATAVCFLEFHKTASFTAKKT